MLNADVWCQRQTASYQCDLYFHVAQSLKGPNMTTSALIVMVLSVGSTVSLFLYCIFKVLTAPASAE